MNPRKDEAFNKALAGVCDTYKCVAWLEGSQSKGYLLTFVALNEDDGADKAQSSLGNQTNIKVEAVKIPDFDSHGAGIPYYPKGTNKIDPGDTLKLLDYVYYVDDEEDLEFLDMWARMGMDPDRCWGNLNQSQ